jgi:regulator of sigma E protease
MMTVLAFVVALGLLIAVHEYGHYRMAVACGVKVLRFSIGFGKPLLRWSSPSSGTEFVVALLPLGGYVRMLDERESPVPVAQRHLAFNNQPLRSRAAIVAAGPLANLMLAVLLYAVVSWVGVDEPRPVLSSPVAASLAERAGLRGGEWVLQVASDGDSPADVESFDDLRWQITRAALSQQDIQLWVADGPQGIARELTLPLSDLGVTDADAALFQKVGIVAPWSAPVMGEVLSGGAAEEAGLRAGDLVKSVDGVAVSDSQFLRQMIRQAVDDTSGKVSAQRWTLIRDGRALQVTVTPRALRSGDGWTGRIGAYVGAAPEMVLVRAGVLDGLWKGVVRTWEVSELTLGMMFKMLVGEASIRNLSGPLTIADYAGKSASLGLTSYLLFLALISVSLGVLNLLPLPVLDGGHLMYYLWEAVTGKPVSEPWAQRLQRGGVAVLFALMSIALFNDISRLFG